MTGTAAICPAHGSGIGGFLPVSDYQDRAGQKRDSLEPSRMAKRQATGTAGTHSLRSVPLSRPDAARLVVTGYRQIKEAMMGVHRIALAIHILPLCFASRSRASLRWAAVVDATLITMAAAININMGNPLNHSLKSSRTAAKQQQKRRKTAVFGSFPAPCHRGGVEPRRITLRKNFQMDSDANDR